MRFERVVFFGRSGAESLAMFALDPAEWGGKRVLDCPGGPGSLSALLRGEGIEVVAVDPLYGEPPQTLRALALADLETVWEQYRLADDLDPGFDLEAFSHQKRLALEAFLDDQRSHPQAYLPAALPRLPFEDASFDLVLCGHLLFSYAPQAVGGLMPEGGFDLDWHRQALAELLRVSRAEVRLYPAHTLQGEARRHGYAERLLAELPREWSGSWLASRYDQGHRGRTEGLRLTRTPG